MRRQPDEPTGKPKKPEDKKTNTSAKPVYGPVATVFTQVNTGSWRIVRPGVNQADCSRCKQCETFCPTAVIRIHGKEEGCDPVEIDMDYCKGCGICAEVCPRNCIEMKDEKK